MQISHTLPFLKTIPPAGGSSSPFDILEVVRAIWQTLNHQDTLACAIFKQLERTLVETFNASKVFLVPSGKDGLVSIFEAVKARGLGKVVLVAAYSCPDIAVAAIRAGLKVCPVDVNEVTLEMEVDSIPKHVESDIGAIVFSNLYGLVDDLASWRGIAQKTDAILIDDACQAILSAEEGKHVGTRGSVGVVSFGRGKALCGIGGGVVVIPSDGAGDEFDLLVREACVRRGYVSNTLGYDFCKDMLIGFLMWLFEHPLLYGLPSSLPFLHLGETIVDLSYKAAPFTAGKATVAISQQRKAVRFVQQRLDITEYYDRCFAENIELALPRKMRALSRSQAVLVRYPIVFSSSAFRDICWEKLSVQRLGASLSYPRAIGSYPELSQCKIAQSVIYNETPVADSVSKRIMTLPTHCHVSETEKCEIVQLVNQSASI